MNTQVKSNPSSSKPTRSGVTAPSSPPKFGDVAEDALESFRVYAKERPEVVALWCLGIGFVLGWKLKPW